MSTSAPAARTYSDMIELNWCKTTLGQSISSLMAHMITEGIFVHRNSQAHVGKCRDAAWVHIYLEM